MIEVIQEQAWSLWNDFEPDFGFNEEYLQVTFSGHRGFHLHYRDPKFFHLDSKPKRLVSHIEAKEWKLVICLNVHVIRMLLVGQSVSEVLTL